MPNLRGVLLQLCCSASLLAAVPASADEPAVAFEADVLPILHEHCSKCHGKKSRKGGLSLHSIGGLARGGEGGEPIVVAGDAATSRLIELIKAGEMPPGDARLSDTEVQILEHWINTAARRELATVDEALSSDLLAARRVHFLFEVKCLPCHGRTKQEGELDMRTMPSILKGGKSGPALVPGDAGKSLLYQRLHDDQMPPRDVRYRLSIRPVSETEQELIAAWIDGGAIDPPPAPGVIDDDGLLVNDEDREWWAYQPPADFAIPETNNRDRVRTPIDAFLLQKLEAKNLTFSSEADRRTLFRRAYVALLGITPSAEETQAFENDATSKAFERMIDRLLNSPRYGERWGQCWLDAAGYADSEGSASADTVYPLVYQYRDYVIRAMNADKPYDRFLLEQLAGDELEDYRTVPRMTEKLRDQLIATGFLRTCIDPTASPETNFLYDRHQVLADTVEIVSSSLMGMTMRCARCHSHKYDPIPQRDYYRFTAIFAAAYTPNDWIKPQQRTMEIAGTEDRREIAEFNATINNQIHPINLKVAAETKTFRERYRREHPGKANAEPKVETLKETYADFKQRIEKLSAEKQKLETQLRKLQQVQNLTDVRPEADPFYLLRRGEWNNRGRRVLPNVPAVLKASPQSFQVSRPFKDAPTTGSRLALANWLIHPDHPLTARVIVNRVWQQHFGRGIVATAEDFGKTGVPPTHPQLLDWLAVDFVNSGWSLKHLHRLIMTSSAWRQQSRHRDEAAAVDPENRLLWRMPLRRMDAEVVRDSMLAVAGKLNLKMYGPAVPVKTLADGQIVAEESDEGNRRSIYLLHRRSTPVTVLETFDAPRLTTNCIQRRTSNVVSQALLMLNSGFVDRQAEETAKRIAAEIKQPSDQIRSAYLHVLGRHPDSAEADKAEQFLRVQRSLYPIAVTPAAPTISSLIGMHAPKGITFDLRALREAHSKHQLGQFSAVAAMGFGSDGAGDAHFYVFLDGELATTGHLTNNTFKTLDVPLTQDVRFLTLITSSNGSMNTDWTFFGNPHVSLIDSAGTRQTIDLADIVGGGDGTGTGDDHGIDPWTGNEVKKREGGTMGTVNMLRDVPWSDSIDGVFVPEGDDGTNEITITSTGIRVKGISSGAGGAYCHIWNGHNNGVVGLKGTRFAERNGPLVDLCLVLLNSAEFLYVD
jgi:mono/diheme cytochrome c family protein